MEHLSVIGAGTMGHSISLSAAWAGMEVMMYGLNEKDIKRGLSGVERKLDVLEESGLLSNAQAGAILGKIRVCHSIERAIDGATFIIEAIAEDIGLKRALFADLDKKCGPDVVLASNTSGLGLRSITADIKNKNRTLITHFWNPAHLVPLVEVYRDQDTEEVYVQRTMNLLNGMNKKPIEVMKEVPGLVGNRLQFALFREAQALLEQGIATKEDIDAAVTFGIGRRLQVTGPLLSADMGGLDVFAAVSDHLFEDLSNAAQSLPTLKRLVSEGKLGDKTGEGYYIWSEDFSSRVNRQREQELIRLMKQDLHME
jgi:3-hydroxybutyryl-CoA dehydrogenase